MTLRELVDWVGKTTLAQTHPVDPLDVELVGLPAELSIYVHRRWKLKIGPTSEECAEARVRRDDLVTEVLAAAASRLKRSP